MPRTKTPHERAMRVLERLKGDSYVEIWLQLGERMAAAHEKRKAQQEART